MNLHTLGWTEDDGEELFTLGWIEVDSVIESTNTLFTPFFKPMMTSTFKDMMNDTV